MRRPPALLLAAWGVALAGSAAAQECRLALVLALDVSSSVDAREDRFQRDGLAKALTSPEVAAAFLAGDPVALTAFEWSGSRAQAMLLPGWSMVRSEEDLGRIATAIAKSRRSHDELPTAVGAALGFAADLLRDGPDCRARTIDMAGDGVGNEGFGPDLAYATFPLDGVTVNALVIGGAEDAERLLAWYRAEVLHGPGAFSVFARSFADYADAMEAKLLRELEAPAVSGLPQGATAG